MIEFHANPFNSSSDISLKTEPCGIIIGIYLLETMNVINVQVDVVTFHLINENFGHLTAA